MTPPTTPPAVEQPPVVTPSTAPPAVGQPPVVTPPTTPPVVEQPPIVTPPTTPPVVEQPPVVTPPVTGQETAKPIMPTPEGTSGSNPNTECPPKNGKLNETCDAKWVTINNFHIQARGNLARAMIEGTINNEGWAANLKLKGKGSVKGGVLTGYITCEDSNVITNIEFKGAVLKGCTLEGSILNTSRLEGKGLIRDIKLGEKAKVKGGRIGGKIEGDAKSPATLDWLEIDQGSELSNVILGKHVSIAPGVKLDDSVQFEPSTTSTDK